MGRVDLPAGYDASTVSAYQVEGLYLGGYNEMMVAAGWLDLSGDRFHYMDFMARQRLTPASHVAYRYGLLKAADRSVTSATGNRDEVDRHQVGFGHWYTFSMKLKLEYVYQRVDEGFQEVDPGTVVANDFDGVVGEVAVFF